MEVQDAFHKLLIRIFKSYIEYGRLGKANGSSFTFAVPERPGYVYCRIENGSSYDIAQCIPMGASLDPYVRMVFFRWNNTLILMMPDPFSAVSIYGEAAPSVGVPSIPMPNRGGIMPVLSVGLEMPTSEFNVTNSPIEDEGSISVTWDSQTANKVLASPNGSTGTPSFRALVQADLPEMSGASSGAAGAKGAVPAPSAGDQNKFLKADATWATPAGSSLVVKEQDGTPSVSSVTEIRVTNGTLTDEGGGAVSINISGGGGGGSLTVSEVDGSPSVSGVSQLNVPNGLLTNNGSGVVTLSRSRRDLYGEPDGSLMGLTQNYWQEFDGSSLPSSWTVNGGSFSSGPTADAGRSCVEIQATGTASTYTHDLSSTITGDFEYEAKVWGDFYSSNSNSNGIEIALMDGSSNLIVAQYFYNISSNYYYQMYNTITGTNYTTGSVQQLPFFMVRPAPLYVRFVRVSGTISCYWSVDGENWIFMCSKASVTSTIAKLHFKPYRQTATIPTKARIFYSRINS